jgi:hypothetical protein
MKFVSHLSVAKTRRFHMAVTPIKEVAAAIEPNDVFTPEVLAMLTGASDNPSNEITGFINTASEDLVGLNAIQLAKLLRDAGIYSESVPKAVKIAQGLLNTFSDFGIRPPLANTSSEPREYVLREETKLKDMDAAQLLAELVKNPNNTRALTLLREQPEVKAAAVKTDEWAVTVNKVLNVEKTTAYLNFLAKPTTHRQSVYRDGDTVTIERALGIVEKFLVHPLVDGETVVEGVDKWELNWTNFDRTRWKAFVWARKPIHGPRSNEQHGYWETVTNPIDLYDTVTDETLNRRYAKIVSDYQKAVAEEDESTNVSLTYIPKTNPVNQAARETESEVWRPSLEDLRRAGVVEAPRPQPTAQSAIIVRGTQGGHVDGSGRDVIIQSGVNIGGSVRNARNVTINSGANVGGHVNATGKVTNYGNVGGSISCSDYDGYGLVGGSIQYR